MFRWSGDKKQSEQQTSERNSRQARRTIRSLTTVASVQSDDDETSFHDANSSLLNVDGEPGDIVPEVVEPIMATPFVDENGVDDEDYYKKLGSLKNRLFNKDEVEFWFTSIEGSMKHMGIKSQWAKREVLHSLLQDDVQVTVKHLLRKDQTAAGTHPYRDLKKELLKKFAPKPEAAFEKAMSRKLTDFSCPSDLAKQLIDDLCTCSPALTSECCQKVIYGMWLRELPLVIRQKLAGEAFNAITYKTLLDSADALHLTTESTQQVAAVKSSVKTQPKNQTQDLNALSQPYHTL